MECVEIWENQNVSEPTSWNVLEAVGSEEVLESTFSKVSINQSNIYLHKNKHVHGVLGNSTSTLHLSVKCNVQR
jgi:adenine-specific DNA methylase